MSEAINTMQIATDDAIAIGVWLLIVSAAFTSYELMRYGLTKKPFWA